MLLEKEKFKRFITVLENRSQVMREPLAKRYVSARPSEQIMPYGYWPPRLAKCCGDGQLREELPVDEHRGASPSSAELPS